MDLLDIVPFMGFIRNDDETIQIIAKAATIVPKACDILGISLSDSESEEDDTAEEAGGRSPQSQQQINRDNDSNNTVSNNADNREVQDARPKPKFNRARQSPSPVQGEQESHVRKSRKRCASTPSTLGQSTSSAAAGAATGTLGEGIPNPPKKRRYPSISTASGSGADTTAVAADTFENLSSEESAIRRKMFQDLELFNEQVMKLAAVEKQKHLLLEKFIQISDYLKKQQQGRQTPPPLDDGINDNTATIDGRHGHDDTPDTPQGNDVTGRDDDVFFTEADLSIGAEETVVVEEEEGQGSEEDTVGSLV